MKNLLLSLALSLGTTASADQWYFEASLEGGAEYWAYTNETGDVSPRRDWGTELWIIKSDTVEFLGENGKCTFSNCSVAFTIDGQSAAPGELGQIVFSNGVEMAFYGTGQPEVFNNSATVGMGTTNNFVGNIRTAEWVDISFGGRTNRFSLAGSSAALDGVLPYLP